MKASLSSLPDERGRRHMNTMSAYIPSSSFLPYQMRGKPPRHQAFRQATKFSSCATRRPRVPLEPRMLLFDSVHALPEFINHVIVSCGIGLAGIVGAKATEEVRALTSGDRRADYFDALARDVDSVRRREELSSEAGDRDWNDVTVDKFSNVLVVPEEVPEIESYDDLRAFDRLLHDAPASKRALRKSETGSLFQPPLPDASDFEMGDDEFE